MALVPMEGQNTAQDVKQEVHLHLAPESVLFQMKPYSDIVRYTPLMTPFCFCITCG